MALFDKEKILDGVGKAVDVANDVAGIVTVAANDALAKTDRVIKEKGIDVKVKNTVNDIGSELKDMGKDIKSFIKK